MPLALDDLPAAVRGAVTQIRLTCLDASASFALDLDRITALHPELLADVDAALVDRLGGRVELGNRIVPAVVDPAPAPTAPFFRLTSYGARPAPERSPAAGVRTDFTGQGFSIRPPSVPFDLLYAVDAVTDDRADAAQAARVRPLRADPALGARRRRAAADGRLGRGTANSPWRRCRGSRPSTCEVATSQRANVAREAAVPPFNRIDVEVDTRAVA